MRPLSACALALTIATAARAQHHDMPGMTMPPAGLPAKPTPAPTTGQNHAHMGHAAPPPAAPLPAGQVEPAKEGTDLPPGDAPAPPPPLPHYADRIWGAAAMAHGRDVMMRRDGGGRRFAQIMLNLAEVQIRDGREGYRWDGEGWFGGDIHRFVVKSEGEGDFGGKAEAAEVQALYSRAIGPYFNLQAGLRHDIAPTPSRTYATIALDGLAPYWFDVEVAVFLSQKGEMLGRIEATYDQRITQRLILQPRVELNLSAQRARAIGLGRGLTSAELGLRLRYEIRREFAPYVGLSWERRIGVSGRLARADGRATAGPALAIGLRSWF